MTTVTVSTKSECIILSEIARLTEHMAQELQSIAEEATRKAQAIATGQFVFHMPDTTRLESWAKERDGLLSAAKAMETDYDAIKAALTLDEGKRARFTVNN